MSGAVAQATNLSFLGVALDKNRALLTASAASGATSLTVNDTSSWPGSGFVTIYDPTSGGSTTETVAYSAATGGTITCSATTAAHTAGNLVVATAAADAPTAYIPVKKFEPFDNLTLLDDTGYRGSMVGSYGTIAGVEHGEYSTEGDVFPESFPWFLGAMLGDYAASGASAPYTHTFAIKNNAGNYGGGQPESLTLTDFDSLTAGGKARAYPGMVVEDIQINFNSEGLLTYTAKLSGYPSGMVAKPTPSWTSTTVPLPVWTGTVSIAGANVLYVRSGEIAMKRAGTVLHTVDGSQVPYGVWLSMLEVTGKMTFIAADETELLRYLNNTVPTTVFSWTTGTGSSQVQIQATATKTAYKTTKVSRGSAFTEIEADLKMDANATDIGSSGGYGPIRWQIKNAQNGSTTPYQ